MSRPLYRLEDAPQGPQSDSHKGLWFDRFFDGYAQDWSVGDQAKRRWIDTVRGSCGSRGALERATLNLYRLATILDGAVYTAQNDWHFVTGLGLPHPVENGFQWHPTLGVPYLPGAAIKGLVRAWFENWVKPRPDPTTMRIWFGSEDKNPTACKEGFITGEFLFFDALPLSPPQLSADIMTPHMGKWYEKGAEDPCYPNVMPGDWHDPIPVPFLVATRTTLLFAIAPRSERGRADLPRILEALESALDWLGAGAKTAVGYGYFVPEKRAHDRLKKSLIDYQRQQEQRDLEIKKQSLSPEMQSVETFRAVFRQAQQTGQLNVNGPINQMRLQFISEALLWSDLDARKASGEALRETMNQLPPSKKRKAEFLANINLLLGKT